MLLLLLFVHLFSEPNGSLTLPETDPVKTLIALKEAKKEGVLLSYPDRQEVSWKRDHENGLIPIDPITHHRVTYELTKGRLGDCLVCFLHAAWISAKTGIPILYRPFTHSEYFSFHRLNTKEGRRNKQWTLSSLDNITLFQKTPTTFFLHYYPESLQEYDSYWYNYGPRFEVDWQDPLFKKEVRRLLAPMNPPKPLHKPADRISVGIHYRDGGTYDEFEDGRRSYPLKFIPFDFFTDSLRKVVDIYEGAPLYVYLFTDHVNPPLLLEKLKACFPNEDIVFDCCKLNNVIDDFFALSEFDCIIRGMSNFSIVSSFYGNPELILTATRAHLEKERTIIDEYTTYFNFFEREEREGREDIAKK